MKPVIHDLAVVTATTNPDRANDCVASWTSRATYDWPMPVIVNGPDPLSTSPYLGVVPAFAEGVKEALATPAKIIVCLHDDVLIQEDGWDEKVLQFFDRHPKCGLAGFGGGRHLGAADIYQSDYDPMQLARQDFVSNMRDAESHGRRVTTPRRVSCLDGFSQIGRREYWEGYQQSLCFSGGAKTEVSSFLPRVNLFQCMADLGIVHHAYDAALGCYAARLGWETWMLPIACHHLGGQTAVLDQEYHAWADKVTGQEGEGDNTFWHASHRIVYDEFRDVLPQRRGDE